MKRTDSSDPNQLAFRSTTSVGGIVAALLFCGVGAALLLSEIPIDKDDPLTTRIVGWAGVVLGAMILTFRTGAVLNREAECISIWFGPGFPLFRRVKRFKPIGVRLRRVLFRHKGHKSWFYPIRVLGRGTYVEIANPSDGMKAWAMAESVASFFGVPMDDATEEVERM